MYIVYSRFKIQDFINKAQADVIGDGYHYLFICNNTEIQSLRSKYIPKYYVQNSSVAKMVGIFSLCNSQLFMSVPKHWLLGG
jgi:hypothetical protein